MRGRVLCVFIAAAFFLAMAAGLVEASGVRIYQKVIMAGSATGDPPDSPANRVDPNTTTSPWAGVGSVVSGNYMGSGVPITRRHVLTAGHLLDFDDDGIIDVSPGSVYFILNYGGDMSHVIGASELHIHPDYTGFLNPGVNDDIAIITLSSDLPPGVPIYPIYDGSLVMGETFWMVGYGMSGCGDVGYTVDASLTVKRVGANDADLFLPDDEGSGVDEVFEFDFDGPTGTGLYGGPTLGNDIETTFGPGDSGGPSFIYDGARWRVVGINTYIWWFSGDTPGTFGTGGGGMLVPAYAGWIRSVTNPIPEPATLFLAGIGAVGLVLRRRMRR